MPNWEVEVEIVKIRKHVVTIRATNEENEASVLKDAKASLEYERPDEHGGGTRSTVLGVKKAEAVNGKY